MVRIVFFLGGADRTLNDAKGLASSRGAKNPANPKDQVGGAEGRKMHSWSERLEQHPHPSA